MRLQQMNESYGYFLKDNGEAHSNLGGDVGQQKGSYGDTLIISPNTYVNKAITIEEERFGSFKTMFG